MIGIQGKDFLADNKTFLQKIITSYHIHNIAYNCIMSCACTCNTCYTVQVLMGLRSWFHHPPNREYPGTATCMYDKHPTKPKVFLLMHVWPYMYMHVASNWHTSISLQYYIGIMNTYQLYEFSLQHLRDCTAQPHHSITLFAGIVDHMSTVGDTCTVHHHSSLPSHYLVLYVPVKPKKTSIDSKACTY